jgi:hypothetical protein
MYIHTYTKAIIRSSMCVRGYIHVCANMYVNVYCVCTQKDTHTHTQIYRGTCTGRNNARAEVAAHNWACEESTYATSQREPHFCQQSFDDVHGMMMCHYLSGTRRWQDISHIVGTKVYHSCPP